MGETTPLRVAAIGDIHVTASPGNTWREVFAEIAGCADVLCLCGDLTNTGGPGEGEAVAELLRGC